MKLMQIIIPCLMMFLAGFYAGAETYYLRPNCPVAPAEKPSPKTVMIRLSQGDTGYWFRPVPIGKEVTLSPFKLDDGDPLKLEVQLEEMTQ